MKQIPLFLLWGALTLFFLWCEKETETGAQKTLPEARQLTDTLQYQQQMFQRAHVSEDSLHKKQVSLSFTYPHFTSESADSLNILVRNILRQSVYDNARTDSLEQVFDQMVASYQALQTDFPEYGIPWELQRKIKVIYNTQPLISLRFAEMVFTGGAHPNRKQAYYSLTRPGCRILELRDIVAPQQLAELQRTAEQEFRRLKDITDGVSLDQAGFWFEGGQFQLPDNFALTRQGLLFYYNPYEIAAYNQGPTRLVLPYEQIRPLLKPAFLPR